MTTHIRGTTASVGKNLEEVSEIRLTAEQSSTWGDRLLRPFIGRLKFYRTFWIRSRRFPHVCLEWRLVLWPKHHWIFHEAVDGDRALWEVFHVGPFVLALFLDFYTSAELLNRMAEVQKGWRQFKAMEETWLAERSKHQ